MKHILNGTSEMGHNTGQIRPFSIPKWWEFDPIGWKPVDGVSPNWNGLRTDNISPRDQLKMSSKLTEIGASCQGIGCDALRDASRLFKLPAASSSELLWPLNLPLVPPSALPGTNRNRWRNSRRSLQQFFGPYSTEARKSAASNTLLPFLASRYLLL